VAKDLVQAAVWFRTAAKQGLASAQLNLGVAYHKGQGVPLDDEEAAVWYQRAADQGNIDAQHKAALRDRSR
jgi:TPR repeat protein